ncbi:hypothetical protein Dsin_016224 [Dipteronia sinensis]|uniref:Uncharacterized protein n=1 Tax=Dipteronia sinensis TaxID=43782 RepID=A0AAE0ADH0_9ROSI|nr:hypothetical protein Dsin_016224 [Dipteronia sinensis]
MNQYAQHPVAHTALDDIIPCVDNASAQETLTRTKEVSSQLVEVWRTYVFQVSASVICTTTGRLTPSLYYQIRVAFNLSYGLYNYGPFLADLQDCTFVQQTFTDIYRDHCPDL